MGSRRQSRTWRTPDCIAAFCCMELVGCPASIATNSGACFKPYQIGWLVRPMTQSASIPDRPMTMCWAEVRTDEDKLQMLAVIDRVSKYAFTELCQRATRRIPADFLRRGLQDEEKIVCKLGKDTYLAVSRCYRAPAGSRLWPQDDGLLPHRLLEIGRDCLQETLGREPGLLRTNQKR